VNWAAEILMANYAVEPGVAGFVDLAHASRANRREDFVRAKLCAFGEWHNS